MLRNLFKNMFLKKKIMNSIRNSPHLIPSFLFGSFIGIINFINIKESPNYNNKHFNFLDKTRFGTFILIKSIIYGSWYPIFIFGITYDAIFDRKQQFNSHFIPYSKYSQRKIEL